MTGDRSLQNTVSRFSPVGPNPMSTRSGYGMPGRQFVQLVLIVQILLGSETP